MKWQQTFSTPLLRVQDGLLPTMVLVAVFIHGIAFYLIQASGPEPGRKIFPTARLSLLDPKKDRNLLEWIDNHDPAAISQQTESPQPPGIFSGEPYEPSYEKVLPEPLPITKDPRLVAHQSLFPPGPVPEVKIIAAAVAQPALQLASQIATSPNIDLKTAALFNPPKIDNDLPLPARFLVTHASRTDDIALFLLQSSGNDSLDSYARRWLTESKIALKNNESSGWVEIFWGAEIWGKIAP